MVSEPILDLSLGFSHRPRFRPIGSGWSV